MLDVHRKAMDSHIIVYHEFLLRYKVNRKLVYGFVEGKEDPMFYRSFIENNLPFGWEVDLIQAGNKLNVLRIFSEFDWSVFSLKRICFFVDRDLSEFITEPLIASNNLYITDNYSIENDLINLGVLKRILEEVLNISNLTPDEVSIIESHFESSLSRFRHAIIPIMSQIIIWRRSGKNPCLNNICLKDIFILNDIEFKLKSQYDSVSSRLQFIANCVNLTLADQNELAKVEKEFCFYNKFERFIRGKYLMWFFVEFALSLHSSIFLHLKRFSVPPKVNVNFGRGNAMTHIAPRGRCPTSLKLFIDQNYGEFISEVQVAFQ